MAQSFIAAATASAIAGSRVDPVSIVLCNDRKTGLGNRAFITVLLKTFVPKNSDAESFENESGSEIGRYVVTASIACRRPELPLTIFSSLIDRMHVDLPAAVRAPDP